MSIQFDNTAAGIVTLKPGASGSYSMTLPVANAAGALTNDGSGNMSFANGLGVGQTWQTVTGTRALGTTYTNSTSSPIMLAIYGFSTATASNVALSVNGGTAFVVGSFGWVGAASQYQGTGVAVIPPGATYNVTMSGANMLAWNELR